MTDSPRPTRDLADRWPRSAAYSDAWLRANASGGACSVWLTEWLTEALDLRPGMRVLDLGAGKASSSVFLHREFGVQVWSVDLWVPATTNLRRIREAGCDGEIFPLHCDARSLPFAGGFFDAVVCIDSMMYLGTDDLYLNYLAHFVREDGLLGIASSGLVSEVDVVPEHLRDWWTQDLWSLHSAAWWRRHWERTGIADVLTADLMPDGWRVWLAWHDLLTDGDVTGDEAQVVAADAGRTLGYVRAVARRRPGVALEEYCWPDPLRSFPDEYVPAPLLHAPRPPADSAR